MYLEILSIKTTERASLPWAVLKSYAKYPLYSHQNSLPLLIYIILINPTCDGECVKKRKKKSLWWESASSLLWCLQTKISQDTIKKCQIQLCRFLSFGMPHTHLCKNGVKGRGSPEGFQSLIGRKPLCYWERERWITGLGGQRPAQSGVESVILPGREGDPSQGAGDGPEGPRRLGTCA